ncbi:autotransporter outer membrane beta-barrel domain-containing protein [Pseudocitrobacter cyperus]|uniref:Autotransporter outer membrane beta-barrel domain-containing protein n=1 Tax=Pseudocitrobacter cyperus TaxID=3112843 RepID=A0ABV0HNJ2_9ENTR
MKKQFQYSLLQRAILIATLGTVHGAYADTIIEKDTVIDGSSPENENYQVYGGATLTASGANVGFIDISSGHLAMKGGLINDYLQVGFNGTADIQDAAIKVAVLMGDTQLSKTAIETQLILSDAHLSATEVSAQQFVAYNAQSTIAKGHFDNTTDPYNTLGAIVTYSSDTSLTESVIRGKESAFYLEGLGDTRYQTHLSRSSVWALEGPALLVARGKHDIRLENGSSAGSQTGELLTAKNGSDVALTLDASQAAGDIVAQDSSLVDVVLTRGSTLSGGMSNVNSLAIDGTSHYEMTRDSDINALSLTGGTVKFATVEPGTLTVGTLSGNGHFLMNMDTAGWQGDLLDITGSASGEHTLHLAASGREAGSSDALTLVRTGGGDAEFVLNGGRLDLGAWQHELVRNGNQWELVQAAGSTSASTDAMLSMASAPQFMHEGELNVLRARLDNSRAGQQSGMWGSVLYNRSDVDGAWGSAYRLEQNGMMLGGDKVTELNAGALTTGAYLSQSTGQLKHARGGKSRVTSYGGGLYATLNADNGWYASGSAQINHFDNKMSARMSDGGTARADWNSWGYGLGLEAGRQIALNDATQLTPFAGLNGWLTPSEHVKLNNGMTAETGDGRSVQAQAGIRVNTNLSVADMRVTPYVTASLSQALVKNGSTRINDTYDFTNDFTGTGGKVSGGISVNITPSTSVWVDASYAKSEHTESPIIGNVGLRIDF